MTAGRSLDLRHLPDEEVSSADPLFTGQVLMAVIEGVMFAILIAMYLYYRLRVDVWPLPGTRLPDLTVPSLALIPLLLSCIGSYYASEAAKKDDRAGMIIGLSANLLLGSLFLVLRGWQWFRFSFDWKADIHASMVWTMLWLHSVDTVADLLFTFVLIIILVLGRHGKKQRVGVHVDSVVWYFIVGIWIPLYGLIYWGPRLLGGGH